MRNITYALFALLFAAGISSCNQREILKERPKDFLTPANSYTTPDAFVSALAQIYLDLRNDLYASSDSWQNYELLGLGSDIATFSSLNPNIHWNTFNADNGYVKSLWGWFYGWIGKANVVIDRANSSDVKWQSDADKNAIIGEAMFLRAFAYHFLANMWGGVPLVLHETTGPKFDYHRASQDSVYLQCQKDLEFAVKWMKTVDQLPGGRAPRAAAYTLLSQVDICLKDYQGAVDAASAVINDPDFYLMTQRFGVYKNFTFNGYDYQGPKEPWGDVYWDLFREGNFNWKAGNHEAIWNVEFDLNAKGGGGTEVNRSGGNFVLERWWGGGGCWSVKDANGVVNWLMDTLQGRPLGTGWATQYTDSLIWEYKGDWNRDIRNSIYNIQRVFYWTNPAGAFYGQPITLATMGDPNPNLFRTTTATSFKKAVTAVHHGIAKGAGSNQNHDQGRIYKDWYIMRLPDDYLLRAEAYFDMGNAQKAADDINAIRNRAHATPVNAGDVNLDLILDERARELYQEDFRVSTLMRMGKFVEYLMKYNPIVIKNGWQLDNHLNKFPIPNSEIETNNGYKLKQNPGY
jgi:hypothetical protein